MCRIDKLYKFVKKFNFLYNIELECAVYSSICDGNLCSQQKYQCKRLLILIYYFHFLLIRSFIRIQSFCSSARNVPSGEERGETAVHVFAGYLASKIKFRRLPAAVREMSPHSFPGRTKRAAEILVRKLSLYLTSGKFVKRKRSSGKTKQRSK